MLISGRRLDRALFYGREVMRLRYTWSRQSTEDRLDRPKPGGHTSSVRAIIWHAAVRRFADLRENGTVSFAGIRQGLRHWRHSGCVWGSCYVCRISVPGFGRAVPNVDADSLAKVPQPPDHAVAQPRRRSRHR